MTDETLRFYLTHFYNFTPEQIQALIDGDREAIEEIIQLKHKEDI